MQRRDGTGSKNARPISITSTDVKGIRRTYVAACATADPPARLCSITARARISSTVRDFSDVPRGGTSFSMSCQQEDCSRLGGTWRD